MGSVERGGGGLQLKQLPKGVSSALLAAVLFGAGTPLAKVLLADLTPLLLAGLLYLGSGVGLTALRILRRWRGEPTTGLKAADLPWLAGAVFFGGVVGPILLMVALKTTPASTTSLLLNLEGMFTALLAWFVFKENFDRRIALGMALIVAGGVVLSWQGTNGLVLPAGAAAVVGACLCWGIDNNLTQKVSTADPLLLASVKGMAAGTVNVTLGFAGGQQLHVGSAVAAMMLGLVAYGLSLALFVVALRHLGTARTGAYFSLAPFVGAAVAVLLLREPVGPSLLFAGGLMAAGTWLHLTEKHEHEHTHEPLEHTHAHVHDDHHRHEHERGTNVSEPHTHPHIHERLVHRHPHYPDIHHRHRHGPS
jgi:drug/metabolite transporter (DMT)-like permease